MTVQGVTANFRPWTATEDEQIAVRYAIEGAGKLAAELSRSVCSVHHRSARLGVIRNRRWTAAEDRRLRELWGEKTVARVAKDLGRTETTTYWRAKCIGLPLGAAQGQEHLFAAAVRTGYGVGQLRRILKWAGVRIARTMSRPDASSSGRHYHAVDSFDVDDAIERWHATETLEAAARRTGWCAETIARDIARLGDDVPARPGGKKHWRIPSALIDRALAHRIEYLTASGATSAREAG